ncbi:MAG TPA: cyclopropane-fatty-acyl-phospholipid synthase family protein [Thermoleophilaceae bacterium]
MNAEGVGRVAIGAMLGRMRVGSVEIVENGTRRRFGHGEPSATVHVRSPRVWAALLRGSRGLAESYADGLWDSPDPADVVRLCALNIEPYDRLRARLAPLRAPLNYLRGNSRRNTRDRARQAISAHYDLGNDLFELMLDPTMTYSCGFFESPETSLEEASLAKLDRVCRKLRLEPEDHVLEIGTGWGSFALHAAAEYGCRVTTTTLSREQYEYAERAVHDAGLDDRVTLLLEDYRDLRGHFDKLVSIEMIEAVGWREFGTFFERCSRLLEPDGTMLLQAITIDDRAYDVEKHSSTFIRDLIFPEGCLPSVEVISSEVAANTDLRLIGLEDISAHYVPTLRAWRANLEQAADELSRRGYDERFQRLWRFYLAYCEAGFAERRIRDVQVLLAKPRFRREPSALLHRVNLEQVRTARLPRRQPGRDADPIAG